ncbi:ATP-binding protein [Saccharophagus degradans]|uniref:histidine kinase n=1 Tax=Saccharophagus degradans TaxID=86304 RepID=A0AAW7XAI2_9GAMM|nr:ATP-binding protein [Saccharophagus degradans]MDO6423364.1 ATP-binding protein [Saccharophagus degradans]MDO6606769.1 ATP-binding protein [Saccharophagus degradans]
MSRIVVSLLLITFAGIIASGWIIDNAFSRYSQQAHSQYQSADEHYGQGLANLINASAQPQQLVRQWNASSERFISLLEPSDLVLPHSLEQVLNTTGQITLQSQAGVTMYFAVPRHQLILAVNRPDIHTGINATQVIFTLAFYGAIFLVLMLWLTPLLLDLKRLRTAANAFGLGNLKQRIVLSRWSHTRDIHSAFNSMADKIEQLLTDNKLLSNALSHELKTPLARLRFGFDMLAEEQDSERKQQYTHRINEDLNEMQSIINALLDYARLDSVEASVKKQVFNAQERLNNCVHAQWVEAKKIDIHNNHIAHVACDPKHFDLVLSNLIKNALLYSNSHIAIRTELTAAQLTLYVEDDGPGVSEHEIKNLFKPFVRGEHTAGQSGHGMGLAIVNRVAQWNKWQVTIGRSPSLGGAQFCIALPLGAQNKI